MGVREQSPPVVDLRAAAGSENPPCPACGDPLFGWTLLRPGSTPVRRCETCGLGVVGGEADRAEALAALTDDRRGQATRTPNRASLQASLGQSGWAALEPGRRFLFTPDALRRLERSGRSRPAVLAMWQTMLNSMTFGHNVACGALGLGAATPAGKGWQRAVDGFISAALALPVMLLAAPGELAAALAGRGGILELRPQAR